MTSSEKLEAIRQEIQRVRMDIVRWNHLTNADEMKVILDRLENIVNVEAK
jgi:hypothetical protein